MERSLAEVLKCSELEPELLAYLLRLVTLPHAAVFAALLVLPHETLSVSTDDVYDYYHALRWPSCRIPENAVGVHIRPSELLPHLEGEHAERLRRLIHTSHDAFLQPALLAPGMGDQKSSEVAQSFHHHLLRSFDCLHDSG